MPWNHVGMTLRFKKFLFQCRKAVRPNSVENVARLVVPRAVYMG